MSFKILFGKKDELIKQIKEKLAEGLKTRGEISTIPVQVNGGASMTWVNYGQAMIKRDAQN